MQQLFFLHSRRKDVENQRQTSKMLKTQVAEADPSDFLVSLEESVFFDFQKIKISSRPLAGGDAVSVNLCCTWK